MLKRQYLSNDNKTICILTKGKLYFSHAFLHLIDFVKVNAKAHQRTKHVGKK